MNLTARRGAALRGTIAIPGDKSCSHRALILGGMASGQTHITGLLESDDVLATARAVGDLGATVERVGDAVWRIEGGAWTSPIEAVDCGNSGTAVRLLMGAVAGMDGVVVTFTGDHSLSKRPMRRVTGLLERMGATIDGGDLLPLIVEGRQLGGIDHRNVPASAQVKSALLLAGMGTHAPVRVVEPLPSRDHSEIMLPQFGVDVHVDDTPGGWSIMLGENRRPVGTDIEIGGDPSSAAFPLIAAALVPGSDIVATGVIVNPLRSGVYETLERMGADIELSNERIQSGEIVADVRVRHSALRPCHVPADHIPAMIDEIPILAVACAFADGESVIEGLGELRVKESDRLGAVVAGLTACGVVALADGDALRIFGRDTVPGGANVITHGDHRIAMAFLTLGLASDEPVTVDEAGMIATSFPGYVEQMQSIGADIA
nr:3-phosphoshikimate 1-carboxyvinyltransferase [uncultured Sphingomonas sp.]